MSNLSNHRLGKTIINVILIAIIVIIIIAVFAILIKNVHNIDIVKNGLVNEFVAIRMNYLNMITALLILLVIALIMLVLVNTTFTFKITFKPNIECDDELIDQ